MFGEGLKLKVDSMKRPVRNYAVEQIVDFFFSFKLLYASGAICTFILWEWEVGVELKRITFQSD